MTSTFTQASSGVINNSFTTQPAGTNDTTLATTAFVMGAFSGRNKLINRNMAIDQRNAGASVALAAVTLVYAVDRFQVRGDTSTGSTAQQSAIAPPGFRYSYKILIGTGASPAASANNYFAQRVEGFNMADFGWGLAGAKTVTLSFWIRSSLTGNFGISIKNSDSSRDFLSSYTISLADTWEYKTITIPGETSGTWLLTNGLGALIQWDLGIGSDFQGTPNGTWQTSNVSGLSGGVKLVATSGATMYITGVQLETGPVATPFEYRPYGLELSLCQRYYEKSYPMATVPGSVVTNGSVWVAGVSGQQAISFSFSVRKRATPTMTIYDWAGTAARVSYYNGSWNNGGTISANYVTETYHMAQVNIAGSVQIGYDWTSVSEL